METKALSFTPLHQGVCGRHGTEEQRVTSGELTESPDGTGASGPIGTREMASEALSVGGRAAEGPQRQLRGHYQYYGRPTDSQSLLKFYRGVVRIWRKWLNRRTRGNRMTWERYKQLLRRYPLLSPQIRHPWTYPESPA